MKNIKKIIPIFLTLIMLINTLAPLFVNANTNIDVMVNVKLSPTEVEFNKNLYEAIKKSLLDQKIDFRSNDLILTIDLTEDLVNKVNKLNLNNASISDLTGIDNFKNLTFLELSGNNLSKNSKLELLNSLPLNYLDLSSNRIEDVSSIEQLINDINSKNGTLILSSQNVKVVHDIVIDENEGADNIELVEVLLPQLLENAGYIKQNWIKQDEIVQQYSNVAPKLESMINRVTKEDNKIKVRTISDSGEIYKGLLKLEIYIHDDNTESGSQSNVNPASQNILNESKFTIYVVVHGNKEEGIYLPDSNLYKAIKEQLSKGQTKNSKLDSYKYLVTSEKENLINEYCFIENLELKNMAKSLLQAYYSVSKETMKIMNESDFYLNKASLRDIIEIYIEITSILNKSPENITEYDRIELERNKQKLSKLIKNNLVFLNSNNVLRYISQSDTLEICADNYEKSKLDIHYQGMIFNTDGIKIVPYNKNSADMFINAYDDAQVIVIDKNIINNDIKSLILNNKQIYNLEGVEKFTGLEDNLNLSHNNLVNIDSIYKLQDNKLNEVGLIRNEYNYWLKDRPQGNLTNSMEIIKKQEDLISSEYDKAINLTNKALEIMKVACALDHYQDIEEVITNPDGTKQTIIKSVENPNYYPELKKALREIHDIIYEISGADYIDEDEDEDEAHPAIENEAAEPPAGIKAQVKEIDPSIENPKIIEDEIKKYEKVLNNEIEKLYNYLNNLYEVFDNQYKQTTLLPRELNYQNKLEYDEYIQKEQSLESLKDLSRKIVDKISIMEKEEALSEIEKEMLMYMYEDVLISDEELPKDSEITYVLEKKLLNLIEKNDYKDFIHNFRKIDLYSQMINYGLIERINNKTIDSEKFYKDFLKRDILNKEKIGLPTTIEEEVLNEFDVTIDEGLDCSLVDGLISVKEIIPNYDVSYLVYDYLESDINYDDSFYPRPRTPKTIVFDAPYSIYLSRCYGTYNKIQRIETDGVYSGYIYRDIGVSEHDDEYKYLNRRLDLNDLVNRVEKREIVYKYRTSYYGKLSNYNDLKALANKLVLVGKNGEDYIDLPSLKKLDVSYNAYLDEIERLPELKNLEELNAGSTYVADLSTVDWASMKSLRKLNLEYNYISNIKPLESIENLKELNVSKNLLSGKLDFNLFSFKDELDSLDLSNNQLEDITCILEYVDNKSKGQLGTYLAKPDTININLNNQNLVKDLRDIEISLKENPEVVNIDLPKIFSQLLALDVERTAFGETSITGRVESEGKYVTLITKTPGEKQGYVKVTAMDGNGMPVETCVGNNTEITIKYKVVDEKAPIVKDEIIIENNSLEELKPGAETKFTAKVVGDNVTDTAVVWSLYGNTSKDTKITEDGTLIIGKDEESTKIIVVAILKSDETVKKEFEVNIGKLDPVEPEKPGEDNNKPVEPENPGEDNNKPVEPENPGEDNNKPVEPENPGEDNNKPVEPENPGEDNNKPVEPENPGEDNNKPVQPEEPKYGYKVEKDIVKGVKTMTPYNDFIEIFKANNEVNIKVMKDNNEVKEGYITTGMKLKVFDLEGKEIASYDISVRGDVNGDGYSDSYDSVLIKAVRMEVGGLELTESQIEACDIDENGIVNRQDSRLSLYHRAEVKGYCLDYIK